MTTAKALKEVKEGLKQIARGVYRDNNYAEHVTEADKDRILFENLKEAEELTENDLNQFWLWQRVNEKITGEKVAFIGS